MEKLLEEIKNKLKEKGYKATPQRQKILEAIIKNQYKHLTVDEIYMLIKKDYPEIGLATVYRTVQLLEEINIVCKFDWDETGIRYELMEPNSQHQHPHLICKNCGRTYAVENLVLDSIKGEMDEQYGFKILDYNLKFYGICKDCNELER